MTQWFDEWYAKYDNLQCDKDSCEDAYDAGQQSRQAEIDELQKRIDEALSAVWNDKCSHTIIDILKGTN